jgi:hypothetical protein
MQLALARAIVAVQAWFNTRPGAIVKGALRVGIAAVVLLNLAIPGTLDQAKAEGVLAWGAFSGAAIAVIQHELIPWALAQLGLGTAA